MRASRTLAALATVNVILGGCGTGGPVDVPAPPPAPPPVAAASCGPPPLPPCNGFLVGAPVSLAISSDGRIHYATWQNQIAVVESDGKTRVIAGTGASGFSGDGGPALAAHFSFVAFDALTDDSYSLPLAFDSEGRLLIADTGNRRVRRIDRDGTVRTVAQFEGPRTGPDGLAVAPDGTLYVSYISVLHLLPDGRRITVNADAFLPRSLAVDPAGTLYVGDDVVCRLRRVALDGTFSCLEPHRLFQLPNGNPRSTWAAHGLAIDSRGGVLLTDSTNNCIWRVAPGTVGAAPYAGQCGATNGFGGDGGPALEARLSAPYGIAADAAGNVYIADSFNGRIRKVDANGIITSITADLRPH
jgi:DNA-binding beta-propeller fold protein YncE